MLLRLLLNHLIILGMLWTGATGSIAQWIQEGGSSIPISTYDDDPFVRKSIVESMDISKFNPYSGGRLQQTSDQIELANEDWIYRRDATSGEYKKFAWNPWPKAISNEQGNFLFQNEERFPFYTPERGPDGKVILKDGLQVWKPNDLHLGMTTAYSAAYAAKEAADTWAGRNLPWGQNGHLLIETQVMAEYQGMYSPSARMLFFGIYPYRRPNETATRIFETATSWELVAHECGHAIHHVLKPYTYFDKGFNQWGESFSDQMAMWASLRNPHRVQTLLAETGGDFNRPNSLSSIAESYGAMIGKGTGIREAFNDLKTSDTSEEVHDRSEVLTGAAYKFFLHIYDEVKPTLGAEAALQQAGNIMGTFLVQTANYTPEDEMPLEEVGKAYLKVDREMFGGRYHNFLVEEFIRREIFDANSEHEWFVHEDSRPYIYLSSQMLESEIEAMLQTNMDLLGLGQDFGLKLHSVTRDERFGQTIVRAQLTFGQGEGATVFDNHAIFVFRADGSLAEYHPPAWAHAYWIIWPLVSTQQGKQFRSLLSQAKRLRLDKHGSPLSIVRNAEGQLTLEAHVMRGEGLNAYMEVYTLKNLGGQRREIMIPPIPPSKSLPSPDDILN